MKLEAYLLVAIDKDGKKMYWSSSAYMQYDPKTIRIFNSLASAKMLMTKQLEYKREYPNYDSWVSIQIEKYILKNAVIVRKEDVGTLQEPDDE